MRFWVYVIFGFGITSHCNFSGKRSASNDQNEGFRLVSANGGLIIRSEPSKQSKRIGILADSEPVKITGESDTAVVIDGISGKWVKITNNSGDGWIFDGFLTKESFSEPCIRKFYSESSKYKAPKWGVNHICGRQQLLENAYVFYRNWWRDREGEYLNEPSRAEHRALIHRIKSDVKVAEMRGNVALISHTSTVLDYSTFTENTDIWVFEENFWYPFEVVYGSGNTKIFDINNDDLPDVVTQYGCCGNRRYKIFVGTEKGVLNKIFETYFFDQKKIDIKYDRCDRFSLIGYNPELRKNQAFTMRCEDNKVILR